MELVIRLHRWHRVNRVKYRIVFVPDPICFTEVPESLGDLSRERDRWQRGLMESMSLHWRMAFNPRYGRVGLLAFPYYILFEMLAPLIELFGYVLVVAAFMSGIIDTPFLVMFFFVAMLYGVFLSVATVLLEEVSFAIYRSNTSLLWLCAFGVLENLGYRQLTVLWRLKGIVKFFFGAKGWGSHKARRGFDSTAETSA
jgi:cellulose synthase/poly-beta-1,6-N-acetylglucosamine synthase-like glycosyltransferase